MIPLSIDLGRSRRTRRDSGLVNLGFATVCAVCSAQLDREPPRPQLVAAVKPVMPLDARNG
jgi:hypothetical protein